MTTTPSSEYFPRQSRIGARKVKVGHREGLRKISYQESVDLVVMFTEEIGDPEVYLHSIY